MIKHGSFFFFVLLCDARYMKRIKEFFEMTRRERRGTILVLVLIVISLAGTVAVRSCRTDVSDGVHAEAMQRFEAEIDSVGKHEEKSESSRKPRAATKKKGKHRSSAKPKHDKPAPQQRPMDPVPQF